MAVELMFKIVKISGNCFQDMNKPSNINPILFCHILMFRYLLGTKFLVFSFIDNELINAIKYVDIIFFRRYYIKVKNWR